MRFLHVVITCASDSCLLLLRGIIAHRFSQYNIVGTMGDAIDDGVGPDLCLQGDLGFIPQRRKMCNNMLPYADQLDKEIVSQLNLIKKNFTIAILLGDIRYGTLHWTSKLTR